MAKAFAELQKPHCASYKGWGTAIFLLGLLFLLKDLGVLTLGGVTPWTIVLLGLGIYLLFTKCVEKV
ncbi:MAG: hypothetical protein KJ574_01560 [Nanoarchaeota archaeon]|nr:hypothetical protein [Nanoarchaeota archaeon]